ncbi:putative gustatory receptor 59f [Ceratitis capitata]|uniref:putative gustatory receptor 59f n=1 Tax=Ceratitis capitata TaxID=7213 RepID=UPI000329DE37|nr:putative gustatory receptor 59f [Ceratitis capitata]
MLPSIVRGSRIKRKSQKIRPFFFGPVGQHITVDVLETDLYRVVQHFLLLSVFFVALPYGAHQYMPTNRSSDHFLLFLHIVWCICIYICLVFAVYGEYTQTLMSLPTIQKPLYFAEYLIYLIHIFHIAFMGYLARDKCRRFLRTIAEFDLALMSFGKKPKYQRLKSFIGAHLFLIFIFLITTAVVDYFYRDCVVASSIRSLTVYLLPNLILCVSLVQYYTLLYAIAQRSIRLNEILHEEISRQKCSRTLQRIRLLYSALQVFTKDVNSAFAPSMVLVYVGSFSNASVNLFLIYKYVDDIQGVAVWWILYSVIWTILHITKMFLILFYNYDVQRQKNSTILIINEIGRTQNKEVEETVTHFVLQLTINTRTNVVCGVAELNLSFITTLLMAMSTVFIFLLQYDITYEALTLTHSTGGPIRNN